MAQKLGEIARMAFENLLRRCYMSASLIRLGMRRLHIWLIKYSRCTTWLFEHWRLELVSEIERFESRDTEDETKNLAFALSGAYWGDE
jgi:hypothetical protein